MSVLVDKVLVNFKFLIHISALIITCQTRTSLKNCAAARAFCIQNPHLQSVFSRVVEI